MKKTKIFSEARLMGDCKYCLDAGRGKHPLYWKKIDDKPTPFDDPERTIRHDCYHHPENYEQKTAPDPQDKLVHSGVCPHCGKKIMFTKYMEPKEGSG